MAPNTKRVFYVNNVAAPVFLDILATRPDIEVDRLENDSADTEADRLAGLGDFFSRGQEGD